MTSVIGQIAERVRVRVREEGLDLAADDDLAARLAHDEVRRYSERALGGSQPLLADESAAADQVVATLTGFGPLQPYLDDPQVEGNRTTTRARGAAASDLSVTGR